jgi:hypothetical protein
VNKLVRLTCGLWRLGRKPSTNGSKGSTLSSSDSDTPLSSTSSTCNCGIAVAALEAT